MQPEKDLENWGPYRLDGTSELAGAVLKRRKNLGLKQFALADEAGVNERTIQRLEKGEKVSEETMRKVMKALHLSAEPQSQTNQHRSRHEQLLWSVAKAASGLHGTPLGFGQFLRRLPDEVLRQARFVDEALLVLITAHTMLIVDGNPNAGIEEDRLAKSVHAIPPFLIVEHLRRIAILRARYPHDPFPDEPPEIAWWSGHPFVAVLYALPDDDRDKLTELILQTGDLRVLAGHTITRLSDAEQKTFLQQVETIDGHLPEFLEWVEAEYGDSQKLAWSEPMSTRLPAANA